MDKVKVGVVGTSWWADGMYLPALKSHPQAEIVAICGRNRQRAAEMAEKYDIAKIYTDYRAMIEQGGLEAIIIGTPDDLHYDIAMRSLEAGLKVLCDKPLALREQQAYEMWRKAEAAHVQNMVLFTYRWIPFFQYVRDLISQGYIGQCYQVELSFLVGHGRQPEYQWRLDSQRSNGVLGDLGSHLIYLARWLVGEIAQVDAQLASFAKRLGPDGEPIVPANDSAVLLLKFCNGAQGVINTSFMTYLADRDMQIYVKLYGSNGSLEINFPSAGSNPAASIFGAHNPDKKFRKLEVPASYWGEVSPTEPFGIFTRQAVGCRLFIDAILENRPASPNFFDGYKVQQVIEAAIESDRTGNRINIDHSR
ncbi:MAG TPA: Gfo/Idh/MocA family oxidoreductase [Candidatus Marinimicrobia bacterium]|nr:Gfo/Idh/MocA family oxidoreductase [Candidatus Neomarinimicrobiota bacterium]HRS52347.1 Gfo/Idh/MocA family oxidoreductase [Candidatus Neomarinimicrobiota bacterium]HRU93004.1 Gfo/Idh/MocA family oxidoreductase [Candidatus Neomarinimicrobiota bacterium]